MQPVSPWIRRNLRVRHHGLLSSLSGSVPAGGAGSRIVRRHGNGRLAHSSTAVLPLRVFLQLLAILVVTLGLLNFSGCAGGFQGYKPTGPTVTRPASVTVPLGQTATFSVSATGTGTISYQWFKNGVAINGATSSSYTTPPTVAGDTGSLFTVTVTGSTGSVTSSPATLTVQLPSSITKSIVPSSATPPYNSSVILVPTFSGGTAVIGSTGVGSSNIASSAVSGGSYPTPLLTAPTTFTLTVTDSQGNVVFTTCLVTPGPVTPGAVSISPITPEIKLSRPARFHFRPPQPAALPTILFGLPPEERSPATCGLLPPPRVPTPSPPPAWTNHPFPLQQPSPSAHLSSTLNLKASTSAPAADSCFLSSHPTPPVINGS